ncbi:hypothetical protein N692_15395 [Lactiplantibacillus plantarum EGD-AQ4]|nr:hypothetical protein N692_15395 [Lactiplantibacillus plantarum EGD-AQ4]
MKLSKKQLGTMPLAAFLIYITIYNSSFKLVFSSSLWQYLVYGMYIVLYTLFIIQQIGRTQKVKQWLYLFVLSLLMFFYLGRGNLNVAIIFLLGLYTVNIMDVRLVLKVYLVSFVIAFVVVIGLAIFKVLPIYEAKYGLLAIGFRNPNTTGFYCTCMVIMHWTLNWRKLSFINWVEIPVATVLLLMLEDFTALLLIVLIVIMKISSPIIEHLLKVKWFSYGLVLLPVIFFGICLWIGHNFNNYPFLSKLNDIFTSRPSIWNYYLANYHMNLFGNQLADVVLTGVNWTVGRGAFDGEYIFFPVINGLVAFVSVMGLLMVSLKKIIWHKQYALFALFLIYLISGISENQLLIPYQCPVAVLMVLICYPEFSFERKADDVKEEDYDRDWSDGGSRWRRKRNYEFY